jgi:Tol biopolymer transport system component
MTSSSDLWTLPLDVNQGKPTGELRRLTEGSAEYIYPTLSDDDTKLVFGSNRSGNFEVWLRNMSTGKETVLTTGTQNPQRGFVSPDGSKVAYTVLENQKMAVYLMPLSGSIDSQKICADCGLPVSWTPDGKSLIYARDHPIRWFLLDAESGRSTALLQHPKYDIHRTQLSPDGQWLAFNPKIGPRKESICVAPFRAGRPPAEKDWIEITDGSGYDGRPLWAPSGNLLYFVSQRDDFHCIWAQRLDPASKRPAGPPVAVQHFHSARRPLNDSLGVFLGHSQIVMSLSENRGNIWMTELAK